jgi:hypothetical protein
MQRGPNCSIAVLGVDVSFSSSFIGRLFKYPGVKVLTPGFFIRQCLFQNGNVGYAAMPSRFRQFTFSGLRIFLKLLE